MKMTAAIVLALAATANAQFQQSRAVQIRTVNFETDTIELFNFGTVDVSLNGWRFCSHDFDQARQYTGANGLNGRVIEAGTSFTIHVNNDAPAGNVDAINRTSLGGAFAAPFDANTAFGLQLFFPVTTTGVVAFGNSTLIADHIQWSVNGGAPGTSETRTGQAVSTGLWTAAGAFIATQADTRFITLSDTSGGLLHGPTNYTVTNPTTACSPADINADGVLSIFDILAFFDAFGAADLTIADFQDDDALNIFDILAFFSVFGAGC